MPRALSQYTDSELFSMLKTEQKEAAFGELYARISNNVFAYCMRVMADRDMAYDLFQETFLRLLQSSARIDTLENVKGYALTIARNLCLNEKKRTRNTNIEFDEEEYTPKEERSSDKGEMLQLIAMAVELLPHDMKEAFVLREYDGLPYNEISTVLGIRTDAAKLRVFRARQKVREILEPYLNEML